MRDLPAPPVLINWFATWLGKQHGFSSLRSLCERVRWTARLERDPRAPFCPECVVLAKAAAGAVLDYIVDSEAEAGCAEQDLRNRMTEAELVRAKGGLDSAD